MPFTPSHSGTSGGSSSSTSRSRNSKSLSCSGTSGSGSSGTGTSSTGSSRRQFLGHLVWKRDVRQRHITTGTSGMAATSSSIVGPSEFTFAGYTWETHNGSAPPVGM